jgi:hypothetical protein
LIVSSALNTNTEYQAILNQLDGLTFQNAQAQAQAQAQALANAQQNLIQNRSLVNNQLLASQIS